MQYFPTMQYAIVDGKRREAFAGGRGSCPTCNAEMIAKCGPRVIHHWSHKGSRNCDPWWENETDWHREWKSYFPEEWREITHLSKDGEIHRADIKTPAGIVIEIQHSSMTDAERQARETFYGNIVWVLDGKGFEKNFHIFHMLPDPNSTIASDIIWAKASKKMGGAARGLFFRLSEAQRSYPEKVITKETFDDSVEMREVHSMQSIRAEVEESYSGHHQYDWIRPRRTWLDSPCPVYIDFGNDFLVKLGIYDESGLPCIHYVAKRKFIQDAMVKTVATTICN